MFCPFIKDECRSDCAFYQGEFNPPYKCFLAEAAIDIKNFAGNDPTESSQINSTLKNIDKKLSDIVKKMEIE